ncbi:hypothetical protein R0135_04770 [Congregibacter variabilis]|uniref:Uncharacterized protein n=1 Tax=Congregibacter variabilis TaxID=3081200 RepID=A0ABZ0I4L3_9GAMM|nr:hypothetical protein R0135_04770 [Congregibacter sp. IMCC43200]
MVLIVIGIVTALAALAALMLRQRDSGKAGRDKHRQGKKLASKRRTVREPLGPYAAVSVKPSSNSCSTAFEMSNLRYLKSAAPSLPVSGCKSPDCQCSFIHHPDRRRSDDDDRRMGIGLQTQLYGANGEANRRENRRGRRLGDRH